jgi:hypothetical protein
MYTKTRYYIMQKNQRKGGKGLAQIKIQYDFIPDALAVDPRHANDGQEQSYEDLFFSPFFTCFIRMSIC